jgi:hypothetical protein
MTNQEISNLITPEFISTLETVLNHLYECPNKLGLDFNEIDFLPGVMKDLGVCVCIMTLDFLQVF